MGTPRSTRSGGIPSLGKAHNSTCPNRHGDDHQDCDCPWRGRYKRYQVTLAKWANITVDPRSRVKARAVLARMVTAIDENRFDPAGEHRSLGTGQRLSDFITEWQTHYADKHNLVGKGQPSMLGVVSRSRLGAMTLKQLAGSPVEIERWLDEAGKVRHWKARTWNHYHQLLFTLFDRATKWRLQNVPRMETNPMTSIERRTVLKTRAFKDVRLDETIEDRLLAACDALNRVQHKPNRTQLTMEKADEIRARVAAGESQVAVAKAFKIKPPTVNGIVKGETWNLAKYRVGTKGTEMKRRLIAAFDMGPRASEMLNIQIQHVEWSRPRELTSRDGQTFKGYKIVLPAQLTKGGKTTEEPEILFVGTPRLSLEIERRRTQLKNKPLLYLFGTEDGKHQKGFRRMWTELFKIVGLDYGRDKGLVWHTTRAEFASRIAELTGDVVLAKELCRHKDLKTTQGYLRVRHDAEWGAVSRLQR